MHILRVSEYIERVPTTRLRPTIYQCSLCLSLTPGVARYAAEAMHLAEEVRLLKAKLTAADGHLQAKLAQVRPAYDISSSCT